MMTRQKILTLKDALAPYVKAGMFPEAEIMELLNMAGTMNDSDDKPRKMYSITEAAALLGLHPKSLWRYIKEGRLQVVRIGKRCRRIPADSLDALMTGKRG